MSDILHTEEIVTIEGKKYLLLDGYIAVRISGLRERLARDFAVARKRPVDPVDVPGKRG